MRAKSIKGKSIDEITIEFNKSIQDGFEPSLAIVFLSVSQDRDAVCELLDSKGIAIWGATTCGEFIDEELEKNSIAISLLNLNPEYFSILFDEFEGERYRDVSQSIAKKSLEQFQTPAFLVAGSNIEADVEEMLHGFEDIAGEEVNIFGGMAGDDYSFTEQFVFTNNKSSSHGIVVLVLDENKIQIKGRATHGWKAVGIPKTVTKSEGNHVYTVDDVPVLEMTKKYGGLNELIEENENQLAEISTNFPIQLQRERGDPVMRPGLIVNWDDGSFICGGNVPQGSKVRFSLPPDFDVMEKVIDELMKLKETEMPEAEALIVFSCAGRIISLGPLMDKEIAGINKIWNAPMVGFFSMGEIARATDGKNDLHNLTTCCVAIREK